MLKYLLNIILLLSIININAADDNRYIELQEQKESISNNTENTDWLTKLSQQEQTEIQSLEPYIDLQAIKHNKDMFNLSFDIWCMCRQQLFIIPIEVANSLKHSINVFNKKIAGEIDWNIGRCINDSRNKLNPNNCINKSYVILGYINSISGILVKITNSNNKYDEYGNITSYKPDSIIYAILIHTSTYFKNLNERKKDLIRTLVKYRKKYLNDYGCIYGCIDYISIALYLNMSFSQFDKLMSDTFTEQEREDIKSVLMIGINPDICYRCCRCDYCCSSCSIQ